MPASPNDSDTNPLLATGGLPAFAAIEPRHVEPAVRRTLAEQREALARAQNVEQPSIEWLQGLERIHDAVQRVWGPVSHLNSVVSTPEMREAFNGSLPMITEFHTELGHNEALYRRFDELKERLPAAQPVEAELVAQTLRDFRLGGVALSGEAKAQFREIMQTLAARQATFEQNLMDATDAFEHHETRREELAGIPEVVLERARAAAVEKGIDGWLLSLDPPTYVAIMSHADSAALRERYYEAWVTRASDRGPHAGRWDNGPLMTEILSLRREAAQMLGFAHYAELSLATKMARSPAEVIDFLLDLARRSKPHAQRDLEGLTAHAGKKLQPWDFAYISERVKQEQLRLSEEELRPYFPLPKVLGGLFDLAAELFGIVLTPVKMEGLWHPSAAFYDIHRRDGSHVGGLLTDMFARQNKRGGAWMDVCFNRARLPGHEQDPVAYLVCNFNPPFGDSPSLLTHGDVVTLFHEFGHALHHLLTKVDYPSLAGINGVAWDAVELPSQFLENYAWLPEVLKKVSGHCRTGDPLPDDKIATLNRSKTFMSGLAMVRQLEFALFDFKLHSDEQPASIARVYELLADVRRDVAVVEAPEYNRFPNTFSHIFGGGYAAGYYSYKWAEVLAADAFAAFEEEGAFNPATAERFRNAVLGIGGSRPALDAFIAFRGRPPKLDPLLRQCGMTEPTARTAPR